MTTGRAAETYTPAEVEALFDTAVRAYGSLRDRGIACRALPRGEPIAPTDVVSAASGLLAAASLEPFELALWNSFGALPPTSTQGV